MLAFPVELLTGSIDGAAVWKGFAWQLFWLAAWAGAYVIVWRRGLRRYGAVGG
jgi:ABC-2 type transport system permease protein